jgi:branched-chain amino acid transport system ATP-binding protein
VSDVILQVERLCKNFGAVEASRNLSFSVERGHVHALIGPNGAGKTTVVNQLSGELLPDSGRIMFNSQDITRIKPHRRARKGLGRSFQITSVFENLSVAENLALSILADNGHNFRFWQNAIRNQTVRRLLPAALERVDLTDQADTPACYLSHGEKRQLEVGMALTGNPEMLMLDEPMAGQGPGGTKELSRLIRALKEKTTVLLVEHDMEAVFSLADRITVLVYGEAIASGTPDEVRNNPEVKTAYLGDD